MTQEQQTDDLIRCLLAERKEYQDIGVPSKLPDKRRLLRSLMNVRPLRPVSGEFLQIQDAYLGAERDRRGVVDGDQLPAVPGDPRIALWQGDITTLRVDAIVNAANSALLGCFYPLHGCIDNIIHSRSGVQLRLACHDIMAAQGHEEPTGGAKITPAFNLPCRYVIHTVGPIITGRVTRRDREALASCYRSCLALAADRGCESMAFCCISTGEFHFPNREAAEVAVETVRDFLNGAGRTLRVIFDVFKDRDLEIYRELLGA